MSTRSHLWYHIDTFPAASAICAAPPKHSNIRSFEHSNISLNPSSVVKDQFAPRRRVHIPFSFVPFSFISHHHVSTFSFHGTPSRPHRSPICSFLSANRFTTKDKLFLLLYRLHYFNSILTTTSKPKSFGRLTVTTASPDAVRSIRTSPPSRHFVSSILPFSLNANLFTCGFRKWR